VRYRSVWSVFFFTSMQSEIAHVKPGTSRRQVGRHYAGRSALLGLWAPPVGTVFSLIAIIIDLLGGEDVTEDLTGPPRIPGQPFKPKQDKVIVIALAVLIALIALSVVVMLIVLK
jgi:hypothetical protein